jgi:hypothetical protein
MNQANHIPAHILVPGISRGRGMGPIRGIGQTPPASCGANPCDAFDYIWVSDDCQNYLSCAGLPPMTFSGQLGAGVQSVTSGAANVVGQGIFGALTNTTTDIILAVLAIVAVGVLVVELK